MKKLSTIILFLAFSFFFSKVNGQNKKTIQNNKICGSIYDSETNKPLAFVNIWIENTLIGSISDIDGHFCIETNDGDSTTFIFSHLSYKYTTKKINNNNNNNVTILLKKSVANIEEVLVSSNKNTNSIDGQTTIPIAISQLDLNENITQNIPEILLKQPGVSLAGTGFHTAPSIRGLSRKRVVVLVDGEKVSSERNVGAPGTFVNPAEIEKIEILKGPYSTLYGSDAVGGVINIITKDYENPYYTDKIGGRLDVSYKSINNGKNANLALNGKLKKFQYRVSGGYRDADEYKEADNDISFNSFFKEYHIGGKLKYEIKEKHQISVKTLYSKGGPIGFPSHSTLVNSIHDNDEHFIIGANYKFKNISKLLQKIEFNITRHQHTLSADIIAHKIAENPNSDKRIDMRKDLSSTDYIIQYDMHFLPHKKLKILAGFDGYLRENIDVAATKKVYNYNTGIFIMQIKDISLANSSQRSYGLFTQADYSISKKLMLNGGLRLNYITTQQPNKPEENRNNNAISGNIAASYKIVKQFSIKASIGSAFRAPDIKELYVTTQTPGGMNISNSELIPEQSINFDLAFVYKSKTNLVQLSTFYNRISNMINLDWDYTTNPRTGTYKNVGQAELYGVELSYNQKIIKDFSGYLNLTKIYGYDVIAKDELMDIPPLQINAGLKYKLKNTLWFHLSGRYSAKEINVTTGDVPTNAFATFDFSTRWKVFKNLNASVSITNIFNESYREHYQFDWIQAPGRSFNAGINFNF